MTPGAPSPGGYNPHTPGSGIEQNSSDWVTTDIQVKVRDTYLDTQVVGQTGVIRSVTVSGAQVVGGAGSPLGSPVSVVTAVVFLFNYQTTSSSMVMVGKRDVEKFGVQAPQNWDLPIVLRPGPQLPRMVTGTQECGYFVTYSSEISSVTWTACSSVPVFGLALGTHTPTPALLASPFCSH